MSVPKFTSFSTHIIHEGSAPDLHTGAVIPALSLASTFAQKSPGVTYPGNYEYQRSGNPTRDNFEKAVAAAEGGKFCAAFASGSATLSCIVHLCKPGDHIVTGDDVYGGTNRYFRNVAGPNGWIVHFVDTTNLEALKAAITPKTAMLWLESPTNPLLKVSDIAAICKLAKAINPSIIIIVDNTFLSPYFQRPLSLGADIAMHSVSKYINGHSDIVMGVLVCNDETMYKRIRYLNNAIGMVPSPFDCHMAHRGLKTLAVRMERHQQNAFAVAKFLEITIVVVSYRVMINQRHSKVARVQYPGLESHPQHAIAAKQQTGYGGMITIWLKGDLSNARQFLETVKLWTLAESLGGVESLIEHPAIMTHASVPAAQRAQLGIDDSLVRLSVGIEDVEDLIADLKHALDAVTLK